MSAILKVCPFRLMRVSLTLERQRTVSQLPVTHRNKSCDKLDKVQQIKTNNKQFLFLLPVNTLMAHNSRRNPIPVSRKDKRANRYCDIALRRENEILYNSHDRYLFNLFSPADSTDKDKYQCQELSRFCRL